MLENPMIYQPVSTWTWNHPWYYQPDSTHESVHPEDTPVTIFRQRTRRKDYLPNIRCQESNQEEGHQEKRSVEKSKHWAASWVRRDWRKQFDGYSDLLLLGTWILHNSNLGTIGSISKVCSHQIQKKQNHQHRRTNRNWYWTWKVSKAASHSRTSKKTEHNCLDVILVCSVQESSQSSIRL